MDPIEELKRYEAALDGHIKTLQDFARAIEAHELHVVPVLRTGDAAVEVSVEVFNFNRDTPGTGGFDGVAAALFYEAYREALPGIMKTAISKAGSSLAEKAAEAKKAVEAKKKELAAASKELDKFLRSNK